MADCLSQVQSDLINIEDSVSQVADRDRQVAETKCFGNMVASAPFIPKTLLDIGSHVC